MTARASTFILGVLSIFVLSSLTQEVKGRWDVNTPLSEVLEGLSGKKPLHKPDYEITDAMIRQGEDLCLKGQTKGPDGKKTRKQSKYFVCTDCHNMVREFPNNGINSAADRLEFAMKNKIPFLQGTSLYGVVNRDSWYNDDYLKKYGALVESSRDTLVNAVQLCATTCSQGRAFEDWELKAVMAYLWSIQLKLGDLNLTDAELVKINAASTENTKGNSHLLKMIKGKYVNISHATFLNVQKAEDRKLGESGDPKKGEFIFKKGCMHCHKDKRVTDLVLDPAKVTMQLFNKNLKKDTDFGLYYITRKGTYPHAGYKAYMPHYTAERMSEEQLEDLVAYIKSRL